MNEAADFIDWDNRPTDGQIIEVLLPSGKIYAGTYWNNDATDDIDGYDGLIEWADGEYVDVGRIAAISRWRSVVDA